MWNNLDDMLGILLSGGCLEIALYYVEHLDDVLGILLDDVVDVLKYRCTMWVSR